MDKNFSKQIFRNQMSVMYGQVLNLIEALENQLTPADLVNMTPIYAKK